MSSSLHSPILISLLALGLNLASATTSAQPARLDADLPTPDGGSAPNFTFAGIPGGIPEIPTRARLEDFGGHPDDQRADDAALEAAIRYLVANGGGALEMDAGIYDLRRPLVIKHDNIVLRGAGMDATTLRFDYALQPGEIRLVGFKAGETLTRDSVIESHLHSRRLKRHQVFIDDTLLFERGPDYGGGDRFWMILPINNYANRLENGPATVRAVAERWDGTVQTDTREVVLDLDESIHPGELRYLNSLASIAFLGDSRSDYRGRGVLAKDGKRGDVAIELRQPAPFEPGDLVMIEAGATHRFIESIGSWRKDIPRKQMLLVTAVEGNSVRFNQPLRMDYPIRDGSVI